MIVIWLIAAATGMLAWSGLGPRLSSSVGVPNSESEAATVALERHFHEDPGASLLLLFEAPPSRWASPAFVRAIEASAQRAAGAAGSKAPPLQSIGPRVAYTTLPMQRSPSATRERIPQIERALDAETGVRTKITGFPVISEELNTIIADDLRNAEAIAIPITAVILVLLFGSLPAVALPLIFALTTISVAMGLVWVEAGLIEVPIYATSVVTLVGIGLAIDYSMLYVARYREEVRRSGEGDPRSPIAVTAQTAGRALIISGVVVAAGLIPLALMPIPFFKGLGLAAIGIPLVSVLAAVTLLPSLLEVLGPHLERMPIVPPRRRRGGRGGDNRPVGRLAGVVMRHPVLFALGAGIPMLLIALPATGMEITGGSGEFLSRAQLPPRDAGQERSPEEASPAPYEVLIDGRQAGGAWRPSTLRAERRLIASVAADPDVTRVQAPVELLRGGPGRTSTEHARAERLGLVDERARFSRIHIVAGSDSGSSAAEALVERLRTVHVPAAGFGPLPVLVGGPASADHDFVHAVSVSIPALALGIVAVMFCLLFLMLRSVLLPLKAIAMSALSVAAACGVMVMAFEFGWGSIVGLEPSERIAAWVPVLLFATLFGISTDYEVFMVTRMREEWLDSGDNVRAVKTGLQVISRVITASALVMLVIFAGFTTSRVIALQQFGVGLVAGVLFDATLVRLLLVPSLMRLMGRWNWTLRSPHPAENESRHASSLGASR